MRHTTRFIFLSTLAAALSAQNTTTGEKQTFTVPMRDGVRLATDVYGAAPGTPRPVLLLRTPYDKNKAKVTAERYADAGYAAVVQDSRGAFASEGQYIHHNNDDQDGFDTLDWISRQPWSNGRAGMWGSSHPGAVQWLAAADRSYGLEVLAPTAASPSLYRTAYLGGALRLALIGSGGPNLYPPPAGMSAPADLIPFFFRLPLADLDKTFGWPMPWMRGILNHPKLDGYWNRQDVTERVDGLDIAAQHIVGYYDFLSRDTVGSFQRLRVKSATERARQNQQLILGPWDHGTIGKTEVAGVDFSSAARLDVAGENLRWFDRFLRSKTTPPQDFPRVRYFVMGRNEWRAAPDWPPPDAVETSFYLRSQGRANTRSGDGMLSLKPPSAAEPPDRFEADPRNPVPAEPGPPPPRAAMFRPVNRASLQDRTDVLVFSAAPQTHELIVAGTVRAELWISVDAPDADWALKLVDVAPDGSARAVAGGILRSTYRESYSKPSPLEPGKIYLVTVDLGHTAFSLAPGHALRLEVAGSCFPEFDRNSHTGEGPFATTERTAVQTVYHAPRTPSRLLLPRLRGPGE